jgi:peroxin-1
MKLSTDVDLSEVARATDGFSGADLQAVLYSAQLDSVKGLLEDEDNIQEFQPEVHQGQLMEAVKNTRPSLTKVEQRKYEQIYKKFEGGESSDFTPGSRATLA